MARIAPWLVALTFASLAAWLGLRPQPRFQEPEHQDNVRAPPQPSEAQRPDGLPELAVATRCLARLDVAEAALRRCRGAGAESVASESPEDQACLGRDGVREAIERAVERELERRIEAQRDRDAQARASRESALDDWAGSALELTPEQREWLREYTCTLSELRQRALAEIAGGGQSPESALEQLREQRQGVLTDLERALGPERYAKLRALGGIGLLGESVDCG